MLPGFGIELFYFFGLQILALCFEALLQTDQGPAIVRVDLQILTIDALGLGWSVGLEQHCTQVEPHRGVPCRRLVIVQLALELDACFQVSDSNLEVSPRCRQLSRHHLLGNGQ